MVSQVQLTIDSSWKRTLVWTLIAAAFIGPGTVTTALRAGADGGAAYLPIALLAAAAGLLLMEMVARLTVVGQQPLGRVVARFGRWWSPLLFLGVTFGCAAYQAGNLTGALGGLQLFTPGEGRLLLLGLALLVGAALWFGTPDRLGQWLAAVVAVLGGTFLYGAVRILMTGTGIVPTAALSPALIVGLVGTTIVPYNFFLAAGLGSGSSLGDMRRGLGLSFGVGALITASIVITGGLLTEFRSFVAAADVLDGLLAGRGRWVLGAGLFAAGLSSALTAPLAAAVAGREMFGGGPQWARTGHWFRLTWLGVLLTGTFVGMLGLNTVYLIVTAQIINGVMVPLLAALVVILSSDRTLLGAHTNRWWQLAGGLLIVVFLTYRNVEVLGEAAGCHVSNWAWIPALLLGAVTARSAYYRGSV